MNNSFLLIVIFLLSGFCSYGKDISIHIAQYPEKGRVILGLLRGHRTHFLDSTRVDDEGGAHFRLPEAAPEGVYRLLLMDDRFIEIIAGDEAVDIHLDYSAATLTDSLVIHASSSTRRYHDVLGIEQNYSLRLAYLSWILRQYHDHHLNPDFEEAVAAEAAKTDSLRRVRIAAVVSESPHSFLARWLIASYTPPPPYSSERSLPYGSERAFLQDHFFDAVDFADTLLLNSTFFSNKFEYFLNHLAGPDAAGQRKAIDLILQKSRSSKSLHIFAAEFLHYYYSRESKPECLHYLTRHPLYHE